MLNFPAGGFPANQPDRRTGCGTWNCLLRERALCPPGVGAAAGAVGTPGQGSAVRPGVGAQGALLLLLVPAAGLGVGGPRGGCSTQDPPGGWGWVAVGKVEQLVHISAAAVWGKFPAWECHFRANNSRNCSALGHLACGDGPSRACSWQSAPSLAACVSLWSVSSPGQSPSVTHKPESVCCPRTALLPQRHFAQMPAADLATEVPLGAGKGPQKDKAKA